jgi:hypothetical protein
MSCGPSSTRAMPPCGGAAATAVRRLDSARRQVVGVGLFHPVVRNTTCSSSGAVVAVIGVAALCGVVRSP